MKKFIKDIMTSQDGESFSMSKLIGLVGSFAMIVQFIRVGSVDFQGFGIGISTLIAAFAAKAYTDSK